MKFVFYTTILVIALTSVTYASRGTTNYQTEDGNERHEEIDADGSLKGHYSYFDPTGKRVLVNYVADKDGFRANGDHFAEFKLGNSQLDKHNSNTEDSHSRPSYNVHKKVPFNNPHKEVPTYAAPEPEHKSSVYNTHKEISSYTPTHQQESSVIKHEIQRPKPRPENHYRPAPVQHYQPETQESYETQGHNGQNDHAVSYVNQETEDNNHNDDDEEEEEEEEEDHSYDAQSYSTYRPPTSKPYFTTKAPKYQPTFKPYYHEQQPEAEHNPVTTKFTIKHPVGSAHSSDSYTIPENQHKFAPSSIEYPDIKTKTTYHSISEDSHYEKPSFESGDHLTNFDTTKLLNDFHNNKPAVSKLPHIPTTKFTIEDVSAPSHGHSYLPKQAPEYTFDDFKSDKAPEYTFNDAKGEKATEYNSNDFKSGKAPEYNFNNFKTEKAPEYTFNDYKSEKAPEYNFNDFKSQKAPEYTFNDFKSEKAPEYTFNDYKSEKLPEYNINDFKSEKAPEYTFNDFKSEKAPEYTFNDFKSEKAPEFNFNDYKSQKNPQYSLTQFNEFKPENFKQPDFSNFFKTETSYSANDFPIHKPQEEEGHIQYLNTKNPANIGQYQQYLKSTEDEKIEQQYIREQLKFKQQPNVQHKRPSYSRPSVNSYHPGRRPPKRPATSAGLGTFRTTFKIPYGFHI